MSQQDTAAMQQPKTLGLERWVQMAFSVVALLLLWVLDRVITLIWDRFAEPQPTLATLGALVVSAVTTYALYRHEKINQVTHEVVAELTKVTWPGREETRVSTIVVIIASVIASIIIGVFDAAWSWVTDFIYKV